MSTHDEDYVAVVDDLRERHVVGVVYYKDFVSAHNRLSGRPVWKNVARHKDRYKVQEPTCKLEIISLL
ncbi:MAG: hypothetical protein ACE5NW_16950 [Acidiferrobacterales bacterium]